MEKLLDKFLAKPKMIYNGESEDLAYVTYMIKASQDEALVYF